jgi:cytoskeletal protein RodZ
MSTPIQEPNFEGEEMKLPAEMAAEAPKAVSTSFVNGPILILLFAILIALLGGIYYWYTIIMATPITVPAPTRPTAEQNNEPESTTAEARTSATDIVSTSDELDAITADVESTRFEDQAADFAAVEAELGGDLGTPSVETPAAPTPSDTPAATTTDTTSTQATTTTQ